MRSTVMDGKLGENGRAERNKMKETDGETESMRTDLWDGG